MVALQHSPWITPTLPAAAPQQRTNSIDSMISALRSEPRLNDLQAAGHPIMESADELAVVGVERAEGGVRPTARNAAAKRFLAEPGMLDAVQGVLTLNAQRAHGDDLDALLLPVGPAGAPLLFDADSDLWGDQNGPAWDEAEASPRRHAFAAGKLAITLHQLVPDEDTAADFVRENADDIVSQVQPLVADWLRNYLWSGQASTGVALLSPEVVDSWRALVRAGRDPSWEPSPAARRNAAAVASTLFHELEHVRSLPRVNEADYGDKAWLEEGGASVLSDWTSEQDALTTAAGIPSGEWVKDPSHEYSTYERIVTRLLDAAGIDQARPGSKHAADALLQDPEFEQVPKVLATAIATNLGRGDDPGYVARVRHAIENGRGTASHLRHIEQVLDRA